ncbi:cobalamin-independent methionine synthase II family protein [Rhodoligotrophos defluvii]|uniref:cobalamin-independent methionine synthase II family protein n=1 Tax=Rhodoligotrophos defluvii TaxID=2561934 RepID=UPI0010C95CA2|nr:cobalamin-independent methionine synthase II family protein [Rhodoligotrophos defluvii]
MKRSVDRILTTHVGSLPRPAALAEAIVKHDRGTLTPAEAEALPGQIRETVAELVGRQIDAGLDIVNDGEASKIGYATYVRERLTGFEGKGGGLTIWDLHDVPEFAQRSLEGLDPATPACTGPIEYRGHAALDTDIQNLKAASNGRDVSDLFMTAASPGVIAIYLENQHYPTDEAYWEAIAEAMRAEYESIVAAGLVLQIDAPDLAMGRHVSKALHSIEDFRRDVARRVEILNHATRNIPSERFRLHLCWGNYHGPHHHDVALADIVEIILRSKAGAISFEGANPRHQHEWRIWEEVSLPDDKILIPGVIDTCTSYVEHPALIAERIERYASIVGHERVVAGTDCGFANFASYEIVDPKIAWMKLAALAEGAALASRNLRLRDAA